MTMLLVAAPLDPTGASVLGRLVALASILAALVLALRWWFHNRHR